ncbi:DUF2269 domain-containing protein [Metabacillus idriensis]|uniref:DUF2269 domain-containing protein n=1 Tax=Metabacillus idriensis TaxID=324768 RepID=UPI00174D8C97|nr:DUF2269 domain-containing protein [Metabacillus idriensis]
MNMTPRIRKFALTAHITSSVGWLGAVVAYLALAIVTKNSQDAQMVRASYLALDPITWYVLVPFAFASLLTGFVMSLGTPWGLFRHYWILFKLLLTILVTLVLLGFTQTMSRMVSVASDPTTSIADLRAMGAGMNHAVGALVVLLVITILSVFKPRGMTRYGWRKQQQEKRKVSQL